MKTRLMRLTASALTAAMLASALAPCTWAADAAKKVTKNETVYVIAGADGQEQEVIVSDWLQNHAGTDAVADSSSLQDIEVVKGDASASGSGSSLRWTTGGEDVYYQGTATADLPVGVSFTYLLDGKETSPESLAGKSGKLTIRIQYTNHTQEPVTVDGQEETMSVPFLMATALILDSGCCKNIEVDHGMAENDGDRTIVMGYGMPGLADSLKLEDLAGDEDLELPDIPDTVEITADVTDFSMEMSVTVATCGLLDDLELTGNETQAELEDALDDLEDATGELLEGTEDLLDGAKELKDGTGELKDGAQQLNDGAGELYDGGSTLHSGAGELNEGAQSLDAGVQSLNSGIEQIQAALTELDSNSATLTAGSAAVKGALLQMQAALGGVSGSAQEIETLVNASGQIKQGIGSLVDNISLMQQSVSYGGYQAVMAQNGLDVAWLRQNNDAAIASLQTMIVSLNQQIAALQAGSTSAAPSQPTTPSPSAPSPSTAQPEPSPEPAPAAEPETTPEIPQESTQEPVPEPAQEEPVQEEPQSADPLSAAPAAYRLTPLASSGTAAQIAQLQAQVDQLSQILLLLQANNANIDGTEAYLTGVNLNLAALLSGAETLQENYALLDSGISQLAAKLSMLLTNVTALSDGVNTLVTEYTALDDGTRAYTNGVAEILAGQQKVTAGSAELVQGSSSLKSGTETLYSGTETMLSGISELYDGTGDLRDGTVELDDGVEELLSGVQQLHDGMEEFKTDGIEKLTALYRDHIPTLIHRLEALQALGQDYNNYSGLPSGADGSVKFLIRTEGISAGEE